MEWILKSLSPKMLIGLLPMLLIKIGNYFKNKDVNLVGADDAFGNVLISLAPAVDALDDGNETAFRKGLEITYKTLGNYLGKQ
jgi:hypothetical protein